MKPFFTIEDFFGFGGLESANDCERAAHLANRLIAERGKVVVGDSFGEDLPIIWSNPKEDKSTPEYPSHQALLILISPIEKPDSAEAIAQELANYKFEHNVGDKFREFVDRARKLLEGE